MLWYIYIYGGRESDRKVIFRNVFVHCRTNSYFRTIWRGNSRAFGRAAPTQNIFFGYFISEEHFQGIDSIIILGAMVDVWCREDHWGGVGILLCNNPLHQLVQGVIIVSHGLTKALHISSTSRGHICMTLLVMFRTSGSGVRTWGGWDNIGSARWPSLMLWLVPGTGLWGIWRERKLLV